MTKTVTAWTFCLTLLLAPTARAEGASSGSVDAQTLLKDLQLSAARAKQQLCAVLKRVPLAPLPAACQAERVRQATNDTWDEEHAPYSERRHATQFASGPRLRPRGSGRGARATAL